MKGSLIVISFFAAGIAVGYLGIAPADADYAAVAIWVLYLLVATVGFEFGYRDLTSTLREITAATLALPLFTIAGTLAAALVAWLVIGRWGPGDYLALGSGMGYYSLSSVLILDYRKAELGLDVAAQLGAIALLTNMAREMLALICAPLYRRFFGHYGPIAAAGVTSLDVALPVIARTCGNGSVPAAVIHGVVLEFSVPLLVYLFCL